MPVWEIRQYYALLVDRKKEESEERRAAAEGRPNAKRERLRPPLSPNEAHGAASAQASGHAPQVQHRIDHAAELAARRAERLAEIQAQKDTFDLARREAKKLGRAITYKGGVPRPAGMHGKAPLAGAEPVQQPPPGTPRPAAVHHYSMRPRKPMQPPFRARQQVGAVPGQFQLEPARAAEAAAAATHQSAPGEPPYVAPAAPVMDPGLLIIKTVASPPRTRFPRTQKREEK